MMDHIELIQQALSYDPRPGFTILDVAAMVTEGKAKVFTSPNAVAIAEDGPEGYLHISICAGDFNEMMEVLLPEVRKYKQENGYKKLTGFGRFGWLKALKALGAEAKAVYFEFD